MISNSDIKLGIIAQTAAGTAPTTGNLLGIDYSEGSFSFSVETEAVESQTLKPNRASAGQRPGKETVKGSFKFRIKKDKAFELMLQSLLGNDWASVGAAGDADDTLISGSKRVFVTLVAQYVDDAGAVTHDKLIGCEFTKITFSGENSAGLEGTAEFVALSAVEGTAGASPLTYVPGSNSLELIGDDIKNITVNGVAISDYTKIDLSIEQPREGVFVLGSNKAKANTASGRRQITISLEYLKATGAPAGFTGAGQAVSFSLDTVYTVSMASVTFLKPVNDFSGSMATAKADGVAGYDNVAATDVMVTRLTA